MCGVQCEATGQPIEFAGQPAGPRQRLTSPVSNSARLSIEDSWKPIIRGSTRVSFVTKACCTACKPGSGGHGLRGQSLQAG